MCLAVPMRLKERNGNDGVVESSGLQVDVNLGLVPSAKVGDYLLVHAGYALTILEEAEARESAERIDLIIGSHE
ncbi:HypC/HybG/HupF family hydrogenase formation chaperone [bacterium]|nr:HypC/HybG/HupF family hydrogenase formation chaperone [bacterium]